MPDIIIEQLCFLLELICYLTLISSLSGIPIKKMRHPFIALSGNFFICSVLSYIFSNALGWIILCLCCFITFSYILHVSFFKSSIAYVLSYALLSLIQDIVVMAFNRFSIQDKAFSSFLGSAISTILSPSVIIILPRTGCISCVPSRIMPFVKAYFIATSPFTFYYIIKPNPMFFQALYLIFKHF